MKKKAIIILICWILFVCLVWPFRVKSYAVALDIPMISAMSYAIMDSWGISFVSGSATGAGMENFMNNEVENYVNSHGGSITDLFGSEIARIVAGKLVVGQQLYNGVVNFLDSLTSKYNLDSIDNPICQGQYNDLIIPGGVVPGTEMGQLASVEFSIPKNSAYNRANWQKIDGTAQQATNWGIYGYSGKHYFGVYGTEIRLYIQNCKSETLEPYGDNDGFGSGYVLGYIQNLSERLSWNGSRYVTPTVLNPDKEWSGTIGGQDWPDTNIEELIGSIFDDVADNNLDVDGEIIDVPVPPGPIPTWTPVDDVIDGINGLGEELDGIGQDIGDISGHLDDIGDQIGDMSEALEGVQEGIQTQTGVISGAIDQAAQDVVDAIGEQTAMLDQTLTETAEGVQDIAEALQPGEIEPKQFDLRRLFPFCIPFDIHNLLQKFNATPVAPHVQLPFVIQSLGFSYTFDLDFSAFDPVAQAMRTVEFIVFAIGLAWATSKVIKW